MKSLPGERGIGYFRIKWVAEEKPGVIPKILEELRLILHHFQDQSQPMIDQILDGVNSAVLETSTAVQNLGSVIGSLQRGLDFFLRHSLIVKISFAGLTVLLVLLLLFGNIILFRTAFGI